MVQFSKKKYQGNSHFHEFNLQPDNHYRILYE